MSELKPARISITVNFVQDAGDVNDPAIRAVRLAIVEAFSKVCAEHQLKGDYTFHSKIASCEK